MATCILCMQDKLFDDFADEHVFPEAIGGSLILKGALCASCNSRLGHTVDAELANNGLVELARFVLHIEGKSGSGPNPFRRATDAADSSRKLRYDLNKEGELESYVVPSVDVQKTDEGLSVTFCVDASERGVIPEILAKIARRHGVALTRQHLDDVMRTPDQAYSPWIRVPLSMHLSSWKRALLKIAYEMTFHWLGPAYLHDPQAEKLRTILRSEAHYEDGDHGLDAVVTVAETSKIVPYWIADKGMHIALLTRDRCGLLCYVRLFQSFEAVVPVSLSDYGRDDVDLPVIFVDARNGTHREGLVVSALQELVRARSMGADT